MAINYNPADVSNPPDPQVPATPSEVTSGFYDNTPVVIAVDPANQVPIRTSIGASNIDTSPTPPLLSDAQLQAELSGNGVTATVETVTAPAPVNPAEEYAVYQQLADPQPSASEIKYTPEQLDALAAANGVDAGGGGTITEQQLFNNEDAAQITAGLNLARQQTAISTQRGQQQQNDWRVRLQLAQGANYLYKAEQPGILQPLVPTDGIIFPYTPKIDLSYRANYQASDITHSNYKNYFYQSSEVSDISLSCTFTAQDTAQANYVLAVIHFFRSATKMFYGQDAQRGSPPPLVFLSGLGQYQFNQHACLISEFSYNLPADVDYIRAQTTNQAGLNLTSVNNAKQSVATNAVFASIQRLAAAFTTKGALNTTPFGSKSSPNLASGSPTYVPTKIDISLKLIPVVSRQKVSQQFSVKNFANGNGLKGGFW